ncbi:MAG: VOC family protein [bacterium]|nr:VOC family protein [bacterium]
MKRMIEHVALRVTDLKRSVVFYRDVLGLKPVSIREIANGNLTQVVFRVGEDVLVLFHNPNFTKADVHSDYGTRQISDFLAGSQEREWAGGMDHLAFCFDEEEYHAVLRRLEEHGGEIHRGEERNLGAYGVGYASYFYDPDNIEIEIKRYDNPPEEPGPEWYESKVDLETFGQETSKA